MNTLKNLCEIISVSGNEDRIRNYIIENIKNYCDKIEVDTIGNIFAYKKGTKNNKNIMLSAHMDEVGFIISHITDSGYLKFKTIGGIDKRILPSTNVLIGDNFIKGIIGKKAIHLQKKDERDIVFDIDSLYIDIGAKNKKDAEKYINIGDYAGFDSNFVEFGNNKIKAKALDDRAGCYILMELLKNSYDYDITFCFTVQEEVGLRGSKVSAYKIKPDVAIVVETTTASDVPNTEMQNMSTILEKGPALTLMDRTSYSSIDLRKYFEKIANKNNISYQYKTTSFGGNDAGEIAVSGNGCKVLSVSVPCRYIHSKSSVIDKSDLINTKALINEFLNNVGGFFDA